MTGSTEQEYLKKTVKNAKPVHNWSLNVWKNSLEILLTYGKNGLDHIWKTNGNSIWVHVSYFKWPFNKGDRQYKKAVGVTAFA